MTAKLHIEGGDRRPIAIRDYLDLIDQYDYESAEDVYQDAYERGYELGELGTKNMLSTMEKLGIVDQNDPQQLTATGQAFIQVSLYDPNLFFELLHGLYSTAYLRDPGPDRGISWAYYKISEYLNQVSPVDSFTDIKQDIVDDIVYKSEQPDTMFGTDLDDPGSFSRKSVNGYEKFISRLSPTVLTGDEFSLRQRAPEEVLLYTIDAIYESPLLVPAIEYGDLLDFSDEVREVISVATLIDPQAVRDAVEQTAEVYNYMSLESDYRVRLRLRNKVSVDEFA